MTIRSKVLATVSGIAVAFAFAVATPAGTSQALASSKVAAAPAPGNDGISPLGVHGW